MSRILQKTIHWLKKAGRGFTNLYRGPWYKKTVVWATTCVLSVILLLIAVDLNFLYLFGKSPGFKDIKNPVTNEASEIYSADSVLIGRFFSENRTPVEYEDISPIIIQTLIDTEDERFYRHHGIDFQGLFAAVKDIASGRARGASTITQQLAKNLFRVRTQYSTGLLGKIPGVKILVMKAKEWIVAVKLERIFSKEEILTMYFNTVDFGSNSFGIKTACRTYFNTTPDQLTYEQAATLVGLLKATSSYNPKLNPKNSTKRRNVVLTNLYDHGHMVINGHKATRAQLDSLMALPMIVSPRKEERRGGEGLSPLSPGLCSADFYYDARILYSFAGFRNIGLVGRIGRSDMGFFFLFLHSDTGRAHLEVCDVGLYPTYDCGCRSGLPEEILVGRNYYSVVHRPSDSVESHSDELLFHVCDPVLRGSVL